MHPRPPSPAHLSNCAPHWQEHGWRSKTHTALWWQPKFHLKKCLGPCREEAKIGGARKICLGVWREHDLGKSAKLAT